MSAPWISWNRSDESFDDEFAKIEWVGGCWQVVGKVVIGDQRGRLLGFPTANLRPEPPRGAIESGVYAGWCWRANGTIWKCAVSVGYRPTFESGETSQFLVEAHLLGFDSDLYGETLTLRLVERLRSVMPFESVEALKKQIQADVDLTEARLC